VLHFMSASEQDNLLYTCRKHQQWNNIPFLRQAGIVKLTQEPQGI
jgi:hypothetical protein